MKKGLWMALVIGMVFVFSVLIIVNHQVMATGEVVVDGGQGKGAKVCIGAVGQRKGGVEAPQSLHVRVSPPVQLTFDDHYGRGESIAYDGANYWLFYGRSESFTGTYSSGNPDIHDYQVYYKKADSIPGLAAATAERITGTLVTHNENGYLGETGAAYFDGEVWAFATIVSGTTADLYGWYTGDEGATWTEVGPILTGLSSGQAHHDEIAFNGELWVVEGSGDFTTMHSATPKSGGWSTPLTVDAALTGGLAHFFIDGSDLYLAIYSSSSNYIYKYNPTTPVWEKVDEITPPEKYDPTLFKVGDTYVFAQAPWDGIRQYIIAWSNEALDDTFFDGGYTLVTEGRYGSNPWVDMWPIGFTAADGKSYLFFTSERNPDDPAQEIDGNIWVLEVDWDLDNDHYTYVQEAVEGVEEGGTVAIAPGVYVEQVEITKTITLIGSGIGETIIRSPYTLPLKYTSTQDNHPIVYIHDITGTVIQDLTVDGAGRGNNNYRFYGIDFHNAGGTVARVEIKDIRDTPFRGWQHGIALHTYNTDGISRTVRVYDSLFSGFQKNATALNAAAGTPLYVDVRRNVVHGYGATTIIGQNGIQVWASDAVGVIADNYIDGIAYDNTDNPIKWVAVSILDYFADLTIVSNTINGAQVGVYNYDGSSLVGGNQITVEKVGVSAYGIIASDPPDVVPSLFKDEELHHPIPAQVEAALSTLTAQVFSNTIVFSGTVNTETYGIAALAGYGDDDLAFTATYNIIQGFDRGIGIYQCEGSCENGEFVATLATHNCFSDNEYGMESNISTTLVNAEWNYWGDPTGPYHPTLNPQGQGDRVSDYIDFEPWFSGCNNLSPVADAGPDQTVDTNAMVTLDGSGSSDPDGDYPLSYLWTQTGGPAVSLSSATVVSPTFTAPSDPAVLTFTLTVTDARGLADLTLDEVVITVTNQPPVADAGPDQAVHTNATVTLDGSGSSDPDDDYPLSYLWTQTGGPAVSLSSATVVSPTFTAPSDPAVLTFTLTVTDARGLADLTPDEVVIIVEPYKLYLPLIFRQFP